MRGIQIRKEKELSLFIGGIVIYIESSKESIKLLEWIN